MKLIGSIFKYPMEYNQITISANVIRIHNTDNSDYGFMQQYRNPETVNSEISFILNKKNYSLLANLKEFELEKQGDVICVEAKDFKAKFADMKDISLIQPDIADMEALNIEYKDIYEGRGFAGAPDSARINLDGATIKKEGIIISNDHRIYLKSLPDESRQEINVPIEAFKRLGNDNYTIKTNGRLAVFINGGRAYYTALINSLTPMIEPPKANVVFEVSRDELIKSLKMLKSYTDTVLIEAKSNTMVLSTKVEANEVKVNVAIKPISLKKILVNCSIDNLSAVLNAVDEETITMNAMNKALYVQHNHLTVLAALMTCQGMEVTGNE